MIDRFENYLHTSLACAGFAIIDSVIACTLRPDLWGRNGGMAAAHDMSSNKVSSISGHRFLLRLEGHHRDIEVIALDGDMLDRRIQWVTGVRVVELIPQNELEGVTDPDPEIAAKPRSTRISDDLYHGTFTAQPGRTCGQCDNLSVSGTCTASKASGIERPAAKVMRRCPGFVPVWGSDDDRAGLELWPEISTQPPTH